MRAEVKKSLPFILVLAVLFVLYVHREPVQTVVFQRWQPEPEPEPIPVMDRSYPLQPDGTFQLPDVQANEAELTYRSEHNIFFIVSTIFKDKLATLTARQSCAIESAARTNPRWKVFVLFVSASGFSFVNSTHVVPLLPYANVFLRHVNLATIGVGTPLEDLLAAGSLNSSSFIVEHTSDLLRLLTLYKYGGTYLDTDVVVMQGLDHLPRNYLVNGADGYVANGIINLQATGPGHALAKDFLREVAEKFDGKQWAANGPFLVTRILARHCNTAKPEQMTRVQCGNEFEVLPPENFLKVRYPRHTWFFEEQHTDEVLAEVSGRVMVHVYNKATGGIRLRRNGKAAYVRLAGQFCPNALWSCGEYF